MQSVLYHVSSDLVGTVLFAAEERVWEQHGKTCWDLGEGGSRAECTGEHVRICYYPKRIVGFTRNGSYQVEERPKREIEERRINPSCWMQDL
jgi:hypothetical protein